MIRVGIECESIEGEIWGIGRIVTKLLEEIARRPELKEEFVFLLYFKSKIPDLPYLKSPLFVPRIIKVPIPWFPLSFSLYYYVFLPIRLWFEKLDIMYFPQYMLPLIFAGKSMVTLTEDLYHEMTSKQMPFRYRLAWNIFGRWAAKRATKVVAVSVPSTIEISKLFHIPLKRIAAIPNAVDTPSESIDRTRRKNYIFYLGQAFPRRHLKETMLAFEKIAPRFPGLQLHAVGYDKYQPRIVETLKKQINHRLGYEAITHRNYVPQNELNNLFANAQLVVYISSKEAFGLPPLEALSYGVPPLVADTYTTRGIFGNNAFFIKNPDSIDAIAEALLDGLMNEEKRNQIIQGAHEIVARYSWPHHVDRFLETVREIVSSS